LGVYQIPAKTNPFLYKLIILEAGSGEKVAELDATSWPTTVEVCGEMLVSYFPSRVFALNMRSGEEIWSRELMDLTYRGPYPPAMKRAEPVPKNQDTE
jgi:hypothetical protein